MMTKPVIEAGPLGNIRVPFPKGELQHVPSCHDN